MGLSLLTENIFVVFVIGGSNAFHRVGHSEASHENIWGYRVVENICYQKEEANPAKARMCLF